MTDPFSSRRRPTRRRAEQFARAVDGGQSVYDAALEPLVTVAGALRTVPEAAPSAQFRESLRGSLMTAASTELAAAPAEPRPERPAPVPPETGGERRRRRRLVVLASSLVLVGGMSGAAAASQQALPGDTLYPIKRGIERLELGLAGSAQARGGELLEQAGTRLGEVERLTAADIDDARVREDITATLQRFATDAGQGGDLLVDSYDTTGAVSDLVEVREFTGTAAGRLDDLADGLPTESQSALRDAVSVIETLDQMAIQACPSCTSSLPAVDLEIDLLSLPQAGDGNYLLPDDAPASDRTGEADGRASGSASGRPDSQANRPEAGGDAPAATPDGPLPTVPDDVLGDGNPDDGPTPGSGGGLLEDDGPVLGDDGPVGTDGPVLGDDGVLGGDGPVLGDDGLVGTDGPVLGDDGLLGSDGAVLGDDGLVGTDGPVLGDDVLGDDGLLGN